MNPKIIFATILILSGIQTYSQDTIKGRIIDYETNQTLPGATIYDRNNNRFGVPSSWNENFKISDRDGNFKIKVEGNKRNLEVSFIGFYPIKFINIPKGDNNINFKEIKLVRNHLTDNIVVGGPYDPISEEQKDQDKQLIMKVLEEYRIKILDKKLKPYFEGKYLVFDFNKNEE